MFGDSDERNWSVCGLELKPSGVLDVAHCRSVPRVSSLLTFG